MRIGIDASFLRKPGTGIGQVTFYFLETLKELANVGDEFFVYTEISSEKGMSYPAHFHFKSFLPWWRRDDLIRKILWERQVAKEAKKDGCDVFLSLYQSSTVTPKKMRHVMVVHDLIPRIFPQYQGNMRQKYYWQMIERGIQKADHIIAVSQATRNDIIEFGIPHESITVASPDVAPFFKRDNLTPEEENRVMATYSLVPGYIYHGGGLEIRKNTEVLLLAYKLLVDKEKEGKLNAVLPPLVISGKIFSESNHLATPVKKLLRELNLGDHVKLLDFVPEKDLPALYKNALFFVYPSLYEGFGLPVLEALHMKTPVLVSDNSSLPEVAGDAALYIDSQHVESVASGMERLVSDADLRGTLSMCAEKEMTRFSWKHFTQTVLESLRSN